MSQQGCNLAFVGLERHSVYSFDSRSGQTFKHFFQVIYLNTNISDFRFSLEEVFGALFQFRIIIDELWGPLHEKKNMNFGKKLYFLKNMNLKKMLLSEKCQF